MTGLTLSLTALAACTLMLAGCASPAPEKKADVPPAGADPKQIFDAQLSNTEREVVSLTEAMPAGKFNFAPTNGNFKGVRTFALEARHISFEINCIAAALLGEPVPSQEHDNGPDELKTKEAIVAYMKDAFAHAHKAVATLTSSNLLESTNDPFDPKARNPRVSSASILLWHTYDHYGQMVEYLRMNGIVPPASQPAGK
jgi:uncharacterized damage-inducible protein DinB